MQAGQTQEEVPDSSGKGGAVSAFELLGPADPSGPFPSSASYAALGMEAWHETLGALDLLKEVVGKIIADIYDELERTLRDTAREDDLLERRLLEAGISTEAFPGSDPPTDFTKEEFSDEALDREWESSAWLFVYRQPGRESEALARYKEVLEIVLEVKAVEYELSAERRRIGGRKEHHSDGLLPEFTCLTLIGGTAAIIELVEDLQEDGVGGFLVCSECEEDEEVFEMLGVEVIMKECGPPVDLS